MSYPSTSPGPPTGTLSATPADQSATTDTGAAPSLVTLLTRASDRLVTPTTVIAALVSVVVLVLGTAALMLYAQEHGDANGAQTVLDDVLKVLGTLASLASATFLIGQRHQLSRVESNTGHIANHVTNS